MHKALSQIHYVQQTLELSNWHIILPVLAAAIVRSSLTFNPSHFAWNGLLKVPLWADDRNDLNILPEKKSRNVYYKCSEPLDIVKKFGDDATTIDKVHGNLWHVCPSAPTENGVLGVKRPGGSHVFLTLWRHIISPFPMLFDKFSPVHHAFIQPNKSWNLKC